MLPHCLFYISTLGGDMSNDDLIFITFIQYCENSVV